MAVLKFKTVEGVRKGRLMFVLVYNQLRRLMLHAARLQGANVNRLRFVDTLAWLRWGDITMMPTLRINPLRPGRLGPGVLKRAKRQFPCMTKPRAQLKAELYAKHKDAA